MTNIGAPLDLNEVIAQLAEQDPDACPDPLSREWVVVARRIVELNRDRDTLMKERATAGQQLDALLKEIPEAFARDGSPTEQQRADLARLNESVPALAQRIETADAELARLMERLSQLSNVPAVSEGKPS